MCMITDHRRGIASALRPADIWLQIRSARGMGRADVGGRLKRSARAVQAQCNYLGV